MSTLLPAFAEPEREAQRVFRAVLDGMSRPGRTTQLAGAPDPPPGLGRAAAAILLTLADADVVVWTAADAARPWLAFHTGCRFAAAPQEADFVHASAAGFDASQCRSGPAGRPQIGATLLLEVDDLAVGRGWSLTGPGIDGVALLEVSGLDPRAEQVLIDNHARYPAGFDTMLCQGARFAGLPRSTRIERAATRTAIDPRASGATR